MGTRGNELKSALTLTSITLEHTFPWGKQDEAEGKGLGVLGDWGTGLLCSRVNMQSPKTRGHSKQTLCGPDTENNGHECTHRAPDLNSLWHRKEFKGWVRFHHIGVPPGCEFWKLPEAFTLSLRVRTKGSVFMCTLPGRQGAGPNDPTGGDGERVLRKRIFF
jgi:hypothetical protein